jgi:cell division protein FtsW (lipid II flippase)
MTILNSVAGAILVAFGLFLIGLAVVVFAKPAVAERFFMAFASSARTHYTEQIVRLLIGASLMIRSAAMWQPKAFWLVGCAIVLSSLVLILTPWQWHDRFGERVRPILIRRVKLFAIGIFVFGVLLIYGVLSAASPMSLTP